MAESNSILAHFYRQRIHQTLDFVSPSEFEKQIALA